MNKIILTLSIVAAFTFSCSDETTKPETEFYPTVVSVRLDSVWNINSVLAKIVEVEVKDPQGFSDLKSIYFRVISENGTTVFSDSLYDNGGLNGSGDVIAGDGFFRNKFLAGFITDQTGAYTFDFEVKDKAGNSAGEIRQSAEFIFLNVNSIENVSAPDTLKSGSSSIPISAVVSSEDGVNQVEKVLMDLLSGNISVLSQPIEMNNSAEDTIFTYSVDSTFAAAREGSYTLQFYTQSRAGDQSEKYVHELFLENERGIIKEVTTPGSIQKPEIGFNQALITAKISDPQGLADVDSVYFDFFFPAGNAANNNPFSMVDNGLAFNLSNVFVESGDKVPNDGTYSLTFLVNNENPAGTYLFNFYMRDKAGNKTAGVAKSIEVQ